MTREELNRIVEDAVREEDLSGKEIPGIDLYVDQIINLVSEKLKTGSERYQDRQLTKTMINNYSKDGMITPIKGKKYNKEQIVQILTIYTLKNTLSIGQIKRLMDGAYAQENFDGEALTEVYDGYLNIKRENRVYAMEILDELMARHALDIENERDFMLVVGSLLSLSAYLRQMAQAIIDDRYPLPEEPEEKKDKDKDKEKEKEKKDKEKEKKVKTKEKSKKKKSDDTGESVSIAPEENKSEQ